MKLGFIGVGNMAGAIIEGLLKADYPTELLYAYNRSVGKVEPYNIHLCLNEQEVCQNSDIVFIGVKPKDIETVGLTIKDYVKNKAIVSMVATYPYQKLTTLFSKETRVLAMMPNTSVKVNSGVILLEETNSLTQEEFTFVYDLCNQIGVANIIDSSLMEVATAISGCSPALFYIVMEAMADGAVKEGLPRDLAYQLISQTMMAAAKMQLETKEHPGMLKDRVCSPKGITIKAVQELEKGNVRYHFMKAIEKAK